MAVLNARFVRPLPEEQILELAESCKALVTAEENALAGGFGSAVAELLLDKGVQSVGLVRLGLPDAFVEHGKQKELRAKIGIDKGGIKNAVLQAIEKTKV